MKCEVYCVYIVSNSVSPSIHFCWSFCCEVDKRLGVVKNNLKSVGGCYKSVRSDENNLEGSELVGSEREGSDMLVKSEVGNDTEFSLESN